MSDAEVRENHSVMPEVAIEPAIGRMLWMIEDTRALTLDALSGVDEHQLDWLPSDGVNSIGTLLYHIAAIEADWLFVEVREEPFPEHVTARFDYRVRDATGRLTVVTGRTLEDHLALLGTIRYLLLDTFAGMAMANYQRPRTMPKYDVTPEWVLHHLMQDEAEHRADISELRRRFALAAAG